MVASAKSGLNGNQGDKTWNAKVMKALRQWYEPDQLAQAVFIADSALVTEDNLKTVQGKGDQPDFQFYYSSTSKLITTKEDSP
ncbi:hypothetical protein [Natribacillus halophilus]|nr:hypothetical protein [Natribacillus halophilus]